MKSGPAIAQAAAAIGDPARANMLTALMSGMALTAGELAEEAGVTPQTASFHLGRLEDAGLIQAESRGRRRYFTLAGPEAAAALEALMALAVRGPQRVRPGPREPALRQARVCYDHLAGELGVQMLDRLVQAGAFVEADGRISLTEAGEARFRRLGVDVAAVATASRPLCRTCLDWSQRRPHLAGGLGAAALQRMLALSWARREPGSRIVHFSPSGLSGFADWLAA